MQNFRQRWGGPSRSIVLGRLLLLGPQNGDLKQKLAHPEAYPENGRVHIAGVSSIAAHKHYSKHG